LISNELTLLDELATRFLKTYQVWHHRRLIVCLTGEWKREMDFVEGILGGSEGDAKNYHTWSYRQWILGYFGGVERGAVGRVGEECYGGVWAGEVGFVEAMLDRDVRNNSAWHHRFFVMWGSGVRGAETDREEVLRRELT
jgi:protein farnesyltransferase/geranylgeranyltransferase type-1 subunit alpha